ncbi:MAG: M3 family metallopeptidase [Caulobacteraceae bacterium]|nr:M3 family metallopeptidase [Caulobacter sp.]
MSASAVAALGLALCVAPCSAQPAASGAPHEAGGGVLLQPSPLFLQAPPFDRIRDGDFQPALEAGMRQQLAEVRSIADNPAPPTFANTLGALERSGATLTRTEHVFDALAQANTNPQLQAVQKAEAPRLSAHHDAIYLDPKLFARVQSLYDRRDRLQLDPEQRQLIKITYEEFVHSGAKLSAADQAKLRDLNQRISTLSTAFDQKLLAATKAGALTVDDKAKLAGLSPGGIAAAAQAAQSRGMAGRWTLPLQNTTQQPDLQSLTDRGVRQALFDKSWTRAEQGGEDDTRATVLELASLRAQKAALFGYPNYAAYAEADQMAGSPQVVERFLGQLLGPTRAKAAIEARDLQAVIDKEGGGFKLSPADWELYAEKVRKARYDLDENEVKPYFLLDTVREQGLFYAANQLYGITFKARPDLPVYDPDVKAYQVFDKDGSTLGLIYFDPFKRDNKAGGAWMSSFVEQSKLLGTKPVVYNVTNFTKPAPGQPALLSFDDVTGMFHEFGHALHGLFADETYPSISGTNVARDFVEFPSQFNEHWALDPKVLAHYAKDYRTGAPIPAALVAKIKKAATFNQGYRLGELLAAAELDMQWHTQTAGHTPSDVDAFETAALKRAGADIPDVPPRYRSSYFSHIWGGGYAAGYYAYLWTEMLDDDAYAWFQAHGGLTRANGQRFRDLILSRGHTLDYGPMFRAFYGQDPQIGPMLQQRGLTSPTAPAQAPTKADG